MNMPQITILIDATDFKIAAHRAAISILDLHINHTSGQAKIDAMAERALHEIGLMAAVAIKELRA